MLNLTQRLTVGCVLLVALSLTLAVWVHRVLVPSGRSGGAKTVAFIDDADGGPLEEQASSVKLSESSADEDER